MIPDKKLMQIVEIITDWIGLKFSDFIFERLVSCNCSIILFGRLCPITWLYCVIPRS